MTDWDQYVKCGGCHAEAGQACFLRSSGGPQALPELLADVPHVNRKLRRSATAAPTARPRTAARKSGTASPARRAARKTAATTTGWQAVADRQRKAREAR